MTKELNTLSPKKWTGDYSGNAPTLDTNDGIYIGDMAIETGATLTDQIWRCLDNTAGSPLWVKERDAVGRTVTLGSTGADYTDFDDAMAAVSALSPGSGNPITLLIYPGTYGIDPTTVPDYVGVVGTFGGTGGVALTANDDDDVILTLGSNCGVSDLRIKGASNTNGVGVKVAGGDSSASIRSCLISNCTTGIWADGSLTSMSVYDSTVFPKISGTTTGCYATDSGRLSLYNTVLQGYSPGFLMTTGCYADGGTIGINGLVSLFCTNAVYVDDGGEVFVSSGSIGNATNAIRMGSTGTDSKASILSVNIQDSTTYDLYLEGSDNELHFISGVFDVSKASIATGAEASINSFSQFPGDEGMVTWGQQEIGRVGEGNELAVGEGDSTVIGMIVQTNTNGTAGSWADETDDAKSSSGSPVTMFPGVAAENCLYIGGDFEFVGFRMSTISTAITLGAGVIDMEYWNGSSWASVLYMETKADAPYTHRANNVFENTDSIQVRFGTRTNWATTALNGETKYWVRIRVTTGITTAPVFEQIKLSTNRNELNADGFRETFGSAEQIKPIAIDYALLDVNGFSSGNKSITFGTNTGIVAQNNNRANSAKDGAGGVIRVPEGLDTSLPVLMTVQWAVDGTATGAVEIEGALAPFEPGDALDGTLTEIADADITTVGVASDDVAQETILSFNIPSAIEGDSIAFSNWRDAGAGNTDDTLSGAIYIVAVTLAGTFWR